MNPTENPRIFDTNFNIIFAPVYVSPTFLCMLVPSSPWVIFVASVNTYGPEAKVGSVAHPALYPKGWKGFCDPKFSYESMKKFLSMELTRRIGVRWKVLHRFHADGNTFRQICLGLLAKQGEPVRPPQHGIVSLQMKVQIIFLDTHKYVYSCYPTQLNKLTDRIEIKAVFGLQCLAEALRSNQQSLAELWVLIVKASGSVDKWWIRDASCSYQMHSRIN